MNFKSVVNQMITPHNETCFLSDQLKKKQSQQKSVISQQMIPPPPPSDSTPWLVDTIGIIGLKNGLK